MSRIVQINATCGIGSTGKIAVAISELLTRQGVENNILYSTAANGYGLGIACGKPADIRLQALKSRILGNYGFNSRAETQRMIAELDRLSPDVVLLHNIHGHDCNLDMLFSYFRKKQTRIVWTLHDCWAFTGYCTHFIFDKCSRWTDGCRHCPQRGQYSWFLDRSAELYRRKKALFSGLNLTIVTPSQWLADLVKQSFLKVYPVKVIHNGIDLSVFRPTPGDFRERHNIPTDRFVILGVAFGWGKRKGLDVFVELSRRLDPQTYQIVLVGTDAAVDRSLPENIISIHRTRNQQELAEIYTAADLFVNPTREEVLGLVNIEAQACGTPVITFRTGGSPECIDESTGIAVDCDDVDAMERDIAFIRQRRPFTREACCERAKRFDQSIRFRDYVDLLTGENHEDSISFKFL